MSRRFSSAATLAATLAFVAPSSASALSRFHSCRGVHGGALYKTQALQTSCSEAQTIWNSFAGYTPHLPPIPRGWQCASGITGQAESETVCTHKGGRAVLFFED
jgi:hypothetical protein